MRFLADESCDFAVVRALCEAGHDVLAVAETAPSAADEAVLRLATVVALVARHGQRLGGCFVVVQPGRVRISRAAES